MNPISPQSCAMRKRPPPISFYFAWIAAHRRGHPVPILDRGVTAVAHLNVYLVLVLADLV